MPEADRVALEWHARQLSRIGGSCRPRRCWRSRMGLAEEPMLADGWASYHSYLLCANRAKSCCDSANSARLRRSSACRPKPDPPKPNPSSASTSKRPPTSPSPHSVTKSSASCPERLCLGHRVRAGCRSRGSELDRYKCIGKVLARTGQERAPPKPSSVVDIGNLMCRPISNVGDLDPGGCPWIPTEPAAHLHGLDRFQGRRLPVGGHELGLCVREVQGARREPLVWPQRGVRYTVGKPDWTVDVGHKTPLT
jgi:hypothetical protein